MEKIEIKLYVSGETPRSKKAIEAIEDVCDQELKGRVTLEVIDVLDRPDLAEKEAVFATPTLIKKLPEPIKRLIGDLSNKEKVLLGLELLVGKDGAA